MTYEPGHRIGEYRIDSKTHTGAYSTEYAAVEEGTGRSVVIKVLGQRHTGEPETVSRFLGPAQAMQDIRSRAVTEILATGRTQQDERPYVVRAATDRNTLHDRIRLGRPANDDDLVRIIGFLSEAVDAVDSHGLVHGDIKAKTVLLRSGETTPGVTFGMLWEDDELVLGDPCPVEVNQDGPGECRVRTDLDAATRVVAEAAAGRLQDDEESFSDLLVDVAAHDRFDLAAALGSSHTAEDADAWSTRLLATVPSSVPSTKPRRAVRALAVPAAVAVALLVALGGIAADFLQRGSSAEQAIEAVTLPTQVPTPESTPTPEPRRDVAPADPQICLDQSSGDDAPNLELESVTHDSVAIRWDSSRQPLEVQVNGTEVATVDAGSPGTHLVDRLAPDSLYAIVVGGPLDESVVCAQTFVAPRAPTNPALAVPAAGAKVITID